MICTVAFNTLAGEAPLKHFLLSLFLNAGSKQGQDWSQLWRYTLICLSAVVRLFLQCKLVGEYLWGPLWIWWYCHHTLQPQWQIGFRSWQLSGSLAASEAGRRFPSYGRDQEKLHPRKVKAQITSMCDKFRIGSSSSGAAIKHTLKYSLAIVHADVT